MKILLTGINAKYIHSNPAIYSLRAYSVSRDPKLAGNLELAEYTINQKFFDILEDIYRRKPDVIAFSCYIWNWNLVQEITEELGKILPDLPIWLGGPEVSFHPERTLGKMPWITGIMTGEGEQTFYELSRFYQEKYREKERENTGGHIPGKESAWEKESLSRIAGLVYRDGERLVPTGERELTDISTLPFFYEDLSVFKNRILYYESSRGCPYRCSYCLSSIDKKVRLRDMGLVKKELQFFLDNKVPQVKFIDRTFNCNHEHAMNIWRYILEHDNGVTNFHFEIAADILNEEELELLGRMRPGLVQLEIGVQSTNPDTIREIRRVMDVKKLAEIVKRIRSGKNVHVHLDLIAGLPYEDFASFRRSFNDVYAMKPEQLQLGFLKVLKGSYMEEKVQDYGIACLSRPPYEVLYTNWLPFEDVQRLKKIEEMVEIYYNSNQFTHILPVLMKNFESPFDFFENLADFYEENGYFYNSPSRAYRYQVLLDFAVMADPKGKEFYTELLVYDMYLRENLKSRPGFAPALEPFHEKIQQFYKKEENITTFLSAYVSYQTRQIARMTHMEAFHYPVWKAGEDELEFPGRKEIEKGGEKQKEEWKDLSFERNQEPFFVLFDYQKRNPLTYEAQAYLVPEEKA